MAGGRIANVMTADFEFFEGAIPVMFLMGMPALIIGSMVILGIIIGPAGIIGIIVSALHVPLLRVFSKII